jgi:hypothetical protein
MATALLAGGTLASPIWERALAVFGGEGTREIVYLVGHYCFISMTLNGFAISVPGKVAVPVRTSFVLFEETTEVSNWLRSVFGRMTVLRRLC